MEILRLDECGKSYDSSVALEPTTLSVPTGEFLTLLGPSGSGKTTLLNLIAGTVAPSSGRIFLEGKDATSLSIRSRKLGMVFQHYALLPHLNIFENVALPLRLRRLPAAEISRRTQAVLELVGLGAMHDRLPRALSSGQQQRVALARAIVYAPKIILMDEPLGALDRQLREQMQDEIRRLFRETGTTFVNVTHDQQEALTMSDRIALLTEGRLQQIGTPDQLYTAPNSRFTATFMGAANIFPAFVVATAGRPTLRSPLGTIFTGEAAFAMRPGEEVEVLVRPEQVPIEAASQNKELNAVNGVLRETVRLGSAQRHWFDVPGSGDCIVDQFRSATSNSLQVGQDYQLHWDYADCRVLKG